MYPLLCISIMYQSTHNNTASYWNDNMAMLVINVCSKVQESCDILIPVLTSVSFWDTAFPHKSGHAFGHWNLIDSELQHFHNLSAFYSSTANCDYSDRLFYLQHAQRPPS